MKTIVGTALVYLLTVSHFANSQPDKDWWACQYIKDTGLTWEDGNWKAANFKMQKPFVLISDGQDSLTVDSVSKATGAVKEYLSCSVSEWAGDIHCQSKSVGTSLSFSVVNQRGVTTQIFGALMPDGDRDTLHLRPFECAKG